MEKTGGTFRALITSFMDFLTVSIHIILYERQIYPQTSFLSARRYNLPVRQSRHPKVCRWINDAVTAVEQELLKGSVDRIVVMIFDQKNIPHERYVFDVSQFPPIPDSALDMPVNQKAGKDDNEGNGGEDEDETDEAAQEEDGTFLPLVDMQEQFRATLKKLSGCSAKLRTLPAGCTFTVAIELKEEGTAPVSHPQPWMPVEARNDGEAEEDSKAPKQNVRTKPVRSVAAGDMMFETWIEQTNAEKDVG
jgi:mitotic spindle assembly checkpoint protein MAD2B